MVECEYDRDPESHSGGCSFNRYMVECEYILKLESKRIITVLIDTWWNVNDDSSSLATSMLKVLIDTW